MENNKKGLPWQVMVGLFILGIIAMIIVYIITTKQGKENFEYTVENGVEFEAICTSKHAELNSGDNNGTGNYDYTFTFEVTKPREYKGYKIVKRGCSEYAFKKNETYTGLAAFEKDYFIFD